jgi:hypothetical protein
MAKGLKIEFLAMYDHPGYFLYEVKLTNEGNVAVEYDMSLLRCNAGRNVLKSRPDYEIDDDPLLGNGTLEGNESITGLVCFIPSSILCTNTPIFSWDGQRIKVDLKKQPKKSKGENVNV